MLVERADGALLVGRHHGGVRSCGSKRLELHRRARGLVPACVQVLRSEAVARARRGDGPTFIELLTYRVSAHSSSDDPSRYRDESVTEEWRAERDPIARTLAFLEDRGWLSAGDSNAFETSLEARVRTVIAEQERIGPPAAATLFADVYETLPWHLKEQERELLEELGEAAEG